MKNDLTAKYASLFIEGVRTSFSVMPPLHA
jgi:hypothetical protein